MGVLALIGRWGEEGYWDDGDEFMRSDDWTTGVKQRGLEYYSWNFSLLMVDFSLSSVLLSRMTSLWGEPLYPARPDRCSLVISCPIFAFSHLLSGLPARRKDGGSPAVICTFCCFRVTSPAIGDCLGMCVDVKGYGGGAAYSLDNNGSRNEALEIVDEDVKCDLPHCVLELRRVLTQPRSSCSAGAGVGRIGSVAQSSQRQPRAPRTTLRVYSLVCCGADCALP